MATGGSPEERVADLQTNFYANYDDVKCDVCPKGNQQRADTVCQECNEHMCPSCRRLHDKWTGGHHVTPLNISQPAKARSERENLCTVHPDQAVCLYFRQCDSGICLHCKKTDHEGHVTSDIASAVVKSESELGLPPLLTEARQQLQVVESSVRHVERDDRFVTRHAETLTQQINARYDLVIATIAQSRDELLEELSEMRERIRGQLQSERSSASVIVDTLSGLVSRASSASGNDAISVKKELQAALLSEDRQRSIRQDSRPRWTYDVPEVSDVPVTACMGRVVEEDADDVIKPLSMAELALKLGRLENDMAENKVEIAQTKAEVTQHKAEITQNKEEITQNKEEITQNKEEITLTKAEVTQHKAEITLNKEEITLTKAEVTQHKAEITLNKAAVTQNKEEITLTKAEVTQNIAGITENITQINTSVKELADKIAKEGTRVAFTAVGIDKKKTKLNRPIVFHDVKVNEGGGYDGTTGVFTAPVAGTYIFSTSVEREGVGQSGKVGAFITVNGISYTDVCGAYKSMATSSVSVQLGEGQTVFVKANCDPDDYHSSSSNSFTGALVQPQL